MTKCHEGSAAKRRLSIRNGIHKRTRPCPWECDLISEAGAKSTGFENISYWWRHIIKGTQ